MRFPVGTRVHGVKDEDGLGCFDRPLADALSADGTQPALVGAPRRGDQQSRLAVSCRCVPLGHVRGPARKRGLGG